MRAMTPGNLECVCEATCCCDPLAPEGAGSTAAGPSRQGPLTFLPMDGEACRGCGCTEHNACMTEDGPCGWARPQICTACLEVLGRVLGPPAIRFLQLACGVVTPGASSSRPGANNLTAADVLQLRDVFTACLELLPKAATMETRTDA